MAEQCLHRFIHASKLTPEEVENLRSITGGKRRTQFIAPMENEWASKGERCILAEDHGSLHMTATGRRWHWKEGL